MKPIFWILIAAAVGVLVTWAIMNQKAKKAKTIGTAVGAVVGGVAAAIERQVIKCKGLGFSQNGKPQCSYRGQTVDCSECADRGLY